MALPTSGPGAARPPAAAGRIHVCCFKPLRSRSPAAAAPDTRTKATRTLFNDLKVIAQRTLTKGGRVNTVLPRGSGPKGREENTEAIIFY